MKSSMTVLFTKYYDDQIKKGEMGGACSAHGEMRNAYKYWLESMKAYLSVDVRIMLK
jgi:hypothetical protein